MDEALSPLVRIIAMAAEMVGDEARATIWFKHQPIPGCGGKTAYDLVRERKADNVIAYLEVVRSGVYARTSAVSACRPDPSVARLRPMWAHDPLCGAGAARFGGRWTRIGQPCLYAARELSTAWAECNHGFVQPLATITQLVLDSARLAYLTRWDVLASSGQTKAPHQTEWRDDLDQSRVPAKHL